MARAGLSICRCVLPALALCAGGRAALAQDVPPASGPERRPIIIGLPTPSTGASGELIVQPNVNAGGELPPALPRSSAPGAAPNFGGAIPTQPKTNQQAGRQQTASGGSIYTQQSAGATVGGTTATDVAPANGPLAALSQWQTPPQTPPQVPASQMPPYDPPVVQPAFAQFPAVRSLLARQPAPMPPAPATAVPNGAPSEELPQGAAPGTVPPPSVVEGPSDGVAQPIFSQAVNPGGGCGCGCGGGDGLSGSGHKGTWYGLGDAKPCDDAAGLGHERVMFALFDMDSSQPESDLRFQFNAVYHEKDPDRAEFFWGEIGVLGPKLPEPFVNWQAVDTSLQLASGKAFSLTTEIPLVLVDPVNNPNTAGLGDVSLTTKTVLLNGNSWQITQYFATYLPTGDAMKGLGDGHVSLEPGFLFQYKWSPETYLHGELKYWFPIGGDPAYGGQVLRYGFGISHLLYENDTFAAIPTLEFVGWTVFDGMQTSPIGIPQMVDTMGIFNIEPGIRFASDTGGDLGVIDWGFHGSFAVTPNRWFNASLMLEIRFLFQ